MGHGGNCGCGLVGACDCGIVAGSLDAIAARNFEHLVDDDVDAKSQYGDHYGSQFLWKAFVLASLLKRLHEGSHLNAAVVTVVASNVPVGQR